MRGAVITLWGTRLLTEEPGDPGSGATIKVLSTRAEAVAHMQRHDPAFDPTSLPPELTQAERAAEYREHQVQQELEKHARWKALWPEWYAAHYAEDGTQLPVRAIPDAPRTPPDPAELRRAAEEIKTNYRKPFTANGKPRKPLVPE